MVSRPQSICELKANTPRYICRLKENAARYACKLEANTQLEANTPHHICEIKASIAHCVSTIKVNTTQNVWKYKANEPHYVCEQARHNVSARWMQTTHIIFVWTIECLRDRAWLKYSSRVGTQMICVKRFSYTFRSCFRIRESFLSSCATGQKGFVLLHHPVRTDWLQAHVWLLAWLWCLCIDWSVCLTHSMILFVQIAFEHTFNRRPYRSACS